MVVALLAAPVYASAWEWLTNHQITSFSGQSGTTINFKWKVNTSGSYHEYRSAYWATSTSAVEEPASWNEWANCRAHGVVTSNITDFCTATAPETDTTTTLWVRATTNYSGCGTYTAFPNVSSCGDVSNVTTTLTP